MTLADLIAAFRLRADDVATPYLWSDDEVTLYLNEAVNEAAERARLIRDASTPAVTQISITTGDVDYALHASILAIDRAQLASQPRSLIRQTVEEMEQRFPDWRGMVGTPHFFVEDSGRIRIAPQSPQADTLNLTVYRLPLAPMLTETDSPEIHAKFHYRLIDWALRCAYLKQDAETLDKQKAADYQALFDLSFGKRPDANVQRKQREHRHSVVKMHW